jgi:SPP1 gp7 family putative phage head morphogenesis protein
VAALQADRAALVKHVDAEASHWAVRASRIARTETTSAYGAGSLHALDSEGVACKGWLATEDARTRPEHRTADGQVVPLHGMFVVGGFLAHYPGDPNLPAELIVNCRCCLIGAECV